MWSWISKKPKKRSHHKILMKNNHNKNSNRNMNKSNQNKFHQSTKSKKETHSSIPWLISHKMIFPQETKTQVAQLHQSPPNHNMKNSNFPTKKNNIYLFKLQWRSNKNNKNLMSIPPIPTKSEKVFTEHQRNTMTSPSRSNYQKRLNQSKRQRNLKR